MSDQMAQDWTSTSATRAVAALIRTKHPSGEAWASAAEACDKAADALARRLTDAEQAQCVWTYVRVREVRRA